MKSITSLLLLLVSMLATLSVNAQTAPVIVPVLDHFSVSGMGEFVTTRVHSGTLLPGQVLETRIDDSSTVKIKVGKILKKNIQVNSAGKEEEVSFQAMGVLSKDISSGMIFSTPGTLMAGKQLTATITIDAGLTLSSPVKEKTSVQVMLYGSKEYANMSLRPGNEFKPGTKVEVTLSFSRPINAMKGTLISIKINNTELNATVVEVLK